MRYSGHSYFFSCSWNKPAATEVTVKVFEGTKYETVLNVDKLIEIAKYFNKYRDECLANGFLSPKILGVNVNILKYQVPWWYVV